MLQAEVRAVIEAFERGAVSEANAVAHLRELIGRDVDAHWLANYWKGESIEEFVDRLCAEPIQDWASITDDRALTLIEEYLEWVRQLKNYGRQDSIATALERKCGKPDGTVNDLVYGRDLMVAGEILKELQKDTRILL